MPKGCSLVPVQPRRSSAIPPTPIPYDCGSHQGEVRGGQEDRAACGSVHKPPEYKHTCAVRGRDFREPGGVLLLGYGQGFGFSTPTLRRRVVFARGSAVLTPLSTRTHPRSRRMALYHHPHHPLPPPLRSTVSSSYTTCLRQSGFALSCMSIRSKSGCASIWTFASTLGGCVHNSGTCAVTGHGLLLRGGGYHNAPIGFLSPPDLRSDRHCRVPTAGLGGAVRPPRADAGAGAQAMGHGGHWTLNVVTGSKQVDNPKILKCDVHNLPYTSLSRPSVGPLVAGFFLVL